MHEDIPVVRICESPVSMTSKRECFFHTVLAVAAVRASAKAGLTGKCSKKLHRRVSHTVVSHPILAQDLVLPRILPRTYQDMEGPRQNTTAPLGETRWRSRAAGCAPPLAPARRLYC